VKAIAIPSAQLYVAERPLQTGLRIVIILRGRAWLRAQRKNRKDDPMAYFGSISLEL
jgi:hypothetical protein